jgi:hypothetical protein
VTISPSCPAIDDFNLTPYALQNSLFAQLLPFQFAGVWLTLEQSGTSLAIQENSGYTFGYQNLPPVEAFNLGYTFGPNSTSLFRLAYSSPSLSNPFTCGNNVGCFTTILVYQVL